MGREARPFHREARHFPKYLRPGFRDDVELLSRDEAVRSRRVTRSRQNRERPSVWRHPDRARGAWGCSRNGFSLRALAAVHGSGGALHSLWSRDSPLRSAREGADTQHGCHLRDPLILHAPASFRNLSGIHPIHRCYRGHEDLISPPPPSRISSPDEEVAVRSHRAPRQTARSDASSGCV